MQQGIHEGMGIEDWSYDFRDEDNEELLRRCRDKIEYDRMVNSTDSWIYAKWGVRVVQDGGGLLVGIINHRLHPSHPCYEQEMCFNFSWSQIESIPAWVDGFITTYEEMSL